jgi:hypothetical protein
VHIHTSYDRTQRPGREYYNGNNITEKLCSILTTEDWSKLVSLKLFVTGAMVRLTQLQALIDALCTVPAAASSSNSDSTGVIVQQQQQQHSAMLYRLEVNKHISQPYDSFQPC